MCKQQFQGLCNQTKNICQSLNKELCDHCVNRQFQGLQVITFNANKNRTKASDDKPKMDKAKQIKQQYMSMMERMTDEQIDELMRVTHSTCNSEASKTQSNPSGKCKKINDCAVHNETLYMCP